MFLSISPFDDIQFYNNHFDPDTNLIFMQGNVRNIDVLSATSKPTAPTYFLAHSLEYADYLLSKKKVKKAEEIINTVISYQDVNTTSDTYGSFSTSYSSHHSENHYVNVTLYTSLILLQLINQYGALLEEPLRNKIHSACHNSSMFIITSMISYTPHSRSKLLEAYYFIMYSDIYHSPQFFSHAVTILNNYYSGVYYNGFFWEYGSFHEIYILSETLYSLKENHSHPEYSELINYLYDALWEYIAVNFHGELSLLSGPQSEIHSIFSPEDFSSFLQIVLNGPSKKHHSLTPIISKCPDKYKFHFSKKRPKKYIYKFISKDSFDSAKPHIAINYIRPYYAIGSFNLSSFWYGYRPVLGYFKSQNNTAYKFELTVFNEDHPFSSAGLNCIQHKNSVLGHISFFTNHGDRHYNLTPIYKKIHTTDFRIRFSIRGATKNLKITHSNSMIVVKNEFVTLHFGIPFIKIDNLPIHFELTKEKNNLYFDAILVNSDTPVELNFSKISTAICQFVIHITSSDELIDEYNYSFSGENLIGIMKVHDNILKLITPFSPDCYEYAIKHKKQYINDIELTRHIDTSAFLAAQNSYKNTTEEALPLYVINKHHEIYSDINRISEMNIDDLISHTFIIMNKLEKENLSITLLKSIVTEMLNIIFDFITKKDFSMQTYIDRNFFNIYQNINSSFSFEEINHIVISCTEQLVSTLKQYKKNTANTTMVEILSCIDNEYGNPCLSLSYLSEKTGTNELTINRLFKKKMNTTYKKYLTSVRMEKAKNLLRENKYTLNEIISLCGYNCYSTFKQAFKEYTKMSISEWRKQISTEKF